MTLHNSPSWTAHLWNSTNVVVDGTRVRNPIKAPNLDGFDIDSCRNVIMRNLDVVTSDDHVSIKSGLDAFGRAFATPSANITIENSYFGIGAGLAIGSEMSGGVRMLFLETRGHCWGLNHAKDFSPQHRPLEGRRLRSNLC